MTKIGITQRIKAAVKGFREGVWWPSVAGVDGDDIGWRRLTGSAERDLEPLLQDRMLEIAYYLYETDPMAKRLINMTAEYIVAEGVNVVAEDEQVQEVIDTFWNDPVNQMNLKLEQKVKELGLWGEQCYPVFVNPVNGHVRLGYLDPALINGVELDPENAEVVRAVVQRDELNRPGKRYEVIGQTEDPLGDGYGLRRGECFFWKINSVTTASRGRSDLLALADYLDMYNQFLFTRGERAAFGNAWIWDVTLEGMTADQIRQWLREHPTPKPGSVRAHNERVKWEAVAPDLKAHDASYDARMIKNYILGGAGFPEHFFAEGGETTRATAAEMGEPVVKHLTSRQVFVQAMLIQIVEFVIDQAILAGRLPRSINRAFDMNFPELSSKDVSKFGTVLVQTAQALLIAQEQGWVEAKDAAGLFCSVASLMGHDIEAAENNEEDGPQNPETNDKLPVDNDMQQVARAQARGRIAMRRVK